MLFALIACQTPAPATPPDGGWSALDALPDAAQEVAVLAVGDAVWVLGGFDDALQTRDTVHVLGADGRWSAGPALPAALHHPNAAVVDGVIHLLGSLRGLQFTASADAWRLDPAVGVWEPLPPVPEPLGASAVGVVGDEILLAGGISGGTVGVAWAFDTAQHTWRALPPLPEPLDHAVGGGGDAFRVIGGRRAGLSDVRDSVLVLTDAGWANGASMPTARAGAAGAPLPDGTILVAGGEGNPADPDGVFAEVERYHPATDTWEVLAPMRTPRHGTGAAAWQGGVVVPGGATVQAFFAVDTVEWLPMP